MTGLKAKLLFISGCLVIYFFRLYSVLQNQIKIPVGARVRLVARISQQPILNASNQIITLGSFLVKTSRLPGYDYGQKLEVIGKPTKRLINPFKTEFIFDYPSIRILSEEESVINQTRFRRFLFNIRGRMENLFLRLLPAPQSSLITGVLLGVKSQFPENLLQNLRKTGTIHIVVASGYNLSVVAGLMLSTLINFIPRKKAAFFAVLGIWLYALMVGSPPAVVRAAIMTSLTMLAQILGREKDGVLGLVLAAIVMLLLGPLILFDIGFQLSFMATAGILVIYPLLRGRLFQMPLIGEDLRVTLAAQLAVLPILLANFGEFNLFSPVINILILPAVPLIMFLGLLIISLAFISRFLALAAAWLAWLPLTYVVNLVNWFGQHEWGLFWLGKIPFWLAIGYYLILGLWIKNSKPSSSV